jgi:acyl carrier protein
MMAEPAGTDAAEQLLGEVMGLLCQLIGNDPSWADRVTPSARLDQDLWLDSLEMAALAGLLRDAFGDRVDLAAFLAGLDFEQLVALTVADLAAHVRACLTGGQAAGQAESAR